MLLSNGFPKIKAFLIQMLSDRELRKVNAPVQYLSITGFPLAQTMTTTRVIMMLMMIYYLAYAIQTISQVFTV